MKKTQQRALISVTDKSGIVEFAHGLEQFRVFRDRASETVQRNRHEAELLENGVVRYRPQLRRMLDL